MKTLASLLLSLLLISCSAQEKSNSGAFEDVSNERAAEIMASTADLQIVDVRQNAEVANGMIEGAMQMDISKPAFYEQIKTLDKAKPVLVYCAAGGRSKTAQEILQENGFTTVYNLENGYSEWK